LLGRVIIGSMSGIHFIILSSEQFRCVPGKGLESKTKTEKDMITDLVNIDRLWGSILKKKVPFATLAIG
jgi:hypothetical protein